MGGGASISALELAPEDLERIVAEYTAQKESGLSKEELLMHVYKFIADENIEIKKKTASTDGGDSTSAVQTHTANRDSLILRERVNNCIQRNNVNYMIGADGSEGSHLCVDVILKLRRKMDTLKVFHSFTDASQDDLPAEKKESGVKEALSIKMLSGINDQSLYKFESERRGENERVKNHISRMLEQLQSSSKAPDIWACGYSGHINQHQNLSHEPSIMGSTKDITLATIKMPVLVIKNNIPDKKRTWIVAVGGKKHSHLALDMALTLAAPRDRIVVIHAYSAENDGTYAADRSLEILEKEYTEELSVRASEESFYKLLSTSEGQSAAEAVVDFVNNDNEIVGDFLVIAPRQNETNECKVSSLTMMLITQTKINLLIVKR